MTVVAFRLPVIAFQRVGGIAIVLKEQDFPVPFGMAAFTRLAEPAFVLVVLLMAGIAVGRRLVHVEVPLMTGFAFGREMPPP